MGKIDQLIDGVGKTALRNSSDGTTHEFSNRLTNCREIAPFRFSTDPFLNESFIVVNQAVPCERDAENLR